MKYFVIGDEDTVTGFSLVGVSGRVANNKMEARESFFVAVAMEDIGIIVITERIANQIRKDVDKYIYETSFPLVLEIPDRNGPLPDRKSIPEMVNAAVGIRV